MIRKALLAICLVLVAAVAEANWQLYHEDRQVVASFDFFSRTPFRGQPSLWVRWHYRHPDRGPAGIKIQFTADCRAKRLYEIASDPYDREGNFLGLNRHEDQPKEYTVTPGSLNEDTYRLMCP